MLTPPTPTVAMTASALIVVTVAYPAMGSAAKGPMPPQPHKWGYGASVHDDGSTAGPGPSPGHASPSNSKPHHDPFLDVCGSFKFGIKACNLSDLPGPKAPAASPEQVAAEAWDRLRLPVPDVATAPPRGSEGLVGLAEWFWVKNWSPRSDRVTAGREWVEVTARPMGLTISPGAGQSPVRCAGPGTAYSRKLPASAQHSDCSYTFRRSSAGLPGGVYRVTVTVDWGGTWRGSGGTGGSLPTVSRSTSFGLRVAEGQAVTGG